jgi:pseudouridine-5'-phosphate glycosidase
MEAAVRTSRAVPATVAVLDGVIRIGLTDTDLVGLAGDRATTWGEGAHSPGSGGSADGEVSHEDRGPARACLAKAGRRDLAAVIAKAQSAATTVSATLWIADRFGLLPRVMATGGLGGVHHEAAFTFDVSNDLDELARADGALIVCSGLKSILDLPATLEALESRGVLVVGYRTSELPGFVIPSTGLPLEHTVDSPAEAAALVRAHRDLRLPGAIVLAQPVPDGQGVDPVVLQTALDAALRDAKVQRKAGKALTPYLLDSIRRATDGASLRANRALLVANARLAAEIAVALMGPRDERVKAG